jgi:hypothetical protein
VARVKKDYVFLFCFAASAPLFLKVKIDSRFGSGKIQYA